jgi:hypothetical protein
MDKAAKQTRGNRTITIDFQNEATYFQLLGDGKAFIEFVVAFLLSLGFQLTHKASCRGGGCLTRHSHYLRLRLGGLTIWRVQCTNVQSGVHGPAALRLALSPDAPRGGPRCPVSHMRGAQFGAVCGPLPSLPLSAVSPRLRTRPPESGHGAHPVWAAAAGVFPGG